MTAAPALSRPAWAASEGQQTKFLACKVREVLGGGAAGGGKTALLIALILYPLAFEHARWIQTGKKSTAWCIHFRRVMPRLIQTINRAQLFYRMVDPGVKYHENTHVFTFTCGLKQQFAHMEKENSYLDYLGAEFLVAAFDELTEFTDEQYTNLETRVRTSDPLLTPFLAVRAASNPVGDGLLWVRKRFVDPWPNGERVLKEKVTLDDGKVVWKERMFIPFKLADNVDAEGTNRLGDDYQATLASKPKHIRDALLRGDWYITPGAFFGEEWDRKVHVIKPFKIPPGWQRFRSGDYGYSAPSSISWWAVDPDGNMICYRNLYIRKHTAEMLAYRIREIEEDGGEWDKNRGCSRLTGPLDPACWANTGHIGPSLAETMMQLGVGWYPGDNERIAGWDQVRRRMLARNDSPLLAGMVKNEDGTTPKQFPQIMWFSTCKAPIRTLPAIPADKNNAEDVDTKSEDHAADDLRLAAMSRPLSGSKENKPWYEDTEDEISAARQRRSGRMAYPGAW